MTCTSTTCTFRATRTARIWVEGVAVELQLCLRCADQVRGRVFTLNDYERLFRARPQVGVQ